MKRLKDFDITVDCHIEEAKGLSKRQEKDLDGRLNKAVASVLTEFALELGEKQIELEIVE